MSERPTFYIDDYKNYPEGYEEPQIDEELGLLIKSKHRFENDPSYFTAEQYVEAKKLSSLLEDIHEQNQKNPNDLINSSDLSQESQELVESYKLDPLQFEILSMFDREISQICEKSLPALLPNNLTVQEKDGIIDSEKYGLKPLDKQLRYFLSRYLIQEMYRFGKEKNNELGKIIKTQLSEVNFAIGKTKQYFTEILQIDVPIYKKLYQEFDELRQDPSKPLEIYLGRDGVYAFKGRLGQTAAKRTRLSAKEINELKNQGKLEEFLPHYKYLIYNRTIRAGRDNEEKGRQRYLEEADIFTHPNPHFFDTGFKGTIPEQIMRIMGFDQEEIDKRIHMAYSMYSHKGERRRNIKGLNRGKSDVDLIESRPQKEESAEGLYENPKTMKLEPVAMPNFPEEQFRYNIAKEAVFRYFWIEEKIKQENKKVPN